MGEKERLEIEGWEEDGRIEGDGRKGFLEERGMMEILVQEEWGRWRPSGAWSPMGPPWQPGGEGTGLAWDRGPGPPSTTALALPPVEPVVQKGCFPTCAGRRGVPAQHTGQTHPWAEPRRH